MTNVAPHRIAWRTWRYGTSRAYHGPWTKTHLSDQGWTATSCPTTRCGIHVGHDVARKGNQGSGTCCRCLATLDSWRRHTSLAAG